MTLYISPGSVVIQVASLRNTSGHFVDQQLTEELMCTGGMGGGGGVGCGRMEKKKKEKKEEEEEKRERRRRRRGVNHARREIQMGCCCSRGASSWTMITMIKLILLVHRFL